MKNEKKGRGGKRPGAGRKSYRKMPNAVQVRISDQSMELLNRFAGELGKSKSELMDLLLFWYLDYNNNDFIICPKCKKACNFRPALIDMSSFDDNKEEKEHLLIGCKHCGHEWEEDY